MAAAARIRALVEDLCSEACAGRAPGTPEGAAARRRIVGAFEAAGLAPGAADGGWLQPVPSCAGANLIGQVPGRGALAERAVLVGAHYDHLGRAGPSRPGDAYWGADDNAAAVAVLAEVAQALGAEGRARELGRQVVVCAFDAEEPPWFLTGGMGSQHYVREPTIPVDRIDAMICMDLVGHAFGPPGLPDDVRRSLFVLGAEKSAGTGALVDGIAARHEGVRARRVGIHVIPPLSDYLPFQEAGVPFLFLTCGRWAHYHETTDTPDRLDYPKIAATAALLTDLTIALSARPVAPVPFLPDGQDDQATLETLGAMVGALAAFSPEAAAAAVLVAELAARARRPGGLGDADRETIAFLVERLEGALA